ncbi:MAG: hypothetical protein F4Y65_00500 [Gammaproteobacteria bacterium]|nr:hypothetical protein [Gammaproteobacteria bacterium]
MLAALVAGLVAAAAALLIANAGLTASAIVAAIKAGKISLAAGLAKFGLAKITAVIAAFIAGYSVGAL